MWRAFLRLTPNLRGFALESAGALILTWLGLRSLGFRRWQRLVSRLTPAAPGTSKISESLLDRCRAMARVEQSVARRLPFRSNCLDQSLALWWMLRRRGVAAKMHIGGRKEDANFEAHAWVEVGGYIFPEMSGGHPAFTPFDRPIEPVETQSR
jgi:transglutaminase superfamily protein